MKFLLTMMPLWQHVQVSVQILIFFFESVYLLLMCLVTIVIRFLTRQFVNKVTADLILYEEFKMK